ncbi:type II 3-dehydroquinate dehydratase [Alkalihalobacterium elongatum]|uniref:type II 3-dehydroquinate dehydratase n=1 Tax=Alkalihalobacterium elongatum TaxID=2675466 RepID=UPI001C1FCE15|nr:type II 3-dehydroquinate dehydratase [Alkalihalobacterium elongatum]
MKSILVINGPNINRLGKREPEIYGHETLADLESRLVEHGKGLGYEILCRQSNHEGQIIDWIHESQDNEYVGIVLNPGAFTHYSYAIRDAVASISLPVIEVHISNVHAREAFRHTSVIAPVTRGQVVGLGFIGYELAIQAIIKGGK